MNGKVKELVAIGASVGAHCQPCLEYHVNKAHEAGLSDDEIREALAVGHMVEKGSMAAMKQFSSLIFDTKPQQAAGSCCGGPSGKKGCC